MVDRLFEASTDVLFNLYDMLTHQLFASSTRTKGVFTKTGFSNYRRAIEKLYEHESSAAHREARLKCDNFTKVPITDRFCEQLKKEHEKRCAGLLIEEAICDEVPPQTSTTLAILN
jgi:hypothetical protein